MKFLISLILVLPILPSQGGILYPKSNIRRDVRSLNGIWKFSIISNDTSEQNTLTGTTDDTDTFPMPVPSSYNDILTTALGREHVGPVKYFRTFSIPPAWLSNRVWIRFGSVRYEAQVYVNDNLVATHDVGHLPFEAEITDLLEEKVYDYNLTVLVNNMLSNETIPQGAISTLPNGREVQSVVFDFYNYAGIDRNVFIYRTFYDTRIEDVTIKTTLKGTEGHVDYQIEINGDDPVNFVVHILDKDMITITASTDQNGTLVVPKVNPWWPYLMDDNPGYLYTLRVHITNPDTGVILDRYDQSLGIRELHWDNDTFTLNGKRLYLRGFGRHEDSDIRGKGFDLPLIVRDHNLIKWIGANCYRTSHYPYAEEIMDLADEVGIMIIDEVPSVSARNYDTENLLDNHKQAIEELYRRDKNRPSVIMWSLANEPVSGDNKSEDYFREVVAHMKSFEETRPITLVINSRPEREFAGQFADILSVNNYAAWYQNPGDTSSIAQDVLNYTSTWRQVHNKPVMMMEYGADTLSGLHRLPDYIWSEEYQLDLMSKHFEVFDQQREEGWFIGEFIWNFADFSTAQALHRIGGNKKGIFTRQRQPKASAHLLRQRYWSLADTLEAATKPEDIERYIINDEEQLTTTTSIAETTRFTTTDDPISTTEGRANSYGASLFLIVTAILFIHIE